jgi:dihydroorotate dehydrogenase (NAD+) catalytic subunit
VSAGTTVDLTVRVGDVALPAPVMTASGTAGHGTELGAYVDLSSLGAVVVKSLSAGPWAGNPSPRVHETPAGMLNSVGLQGPGVPVWRRHELPGLLDAGARVVVSLWGTSVEDYGLAARRLAEPDGASGATLPDGVVAVEVNLSCPNVEERRKVFAHDPSAAAEAVAAVVAAGVGRPVWAKLSPNVTDLVAVAAAVQSAGADAVTLVNTVMGMVLDPRTRRPALGAGGGGLSGRAVHPVAVRAVWDVYAALPDLPIVGVGGVADGWTAAELLLAGASAVQVGTATFADPRAPRRVQDDLALWCDHHGVPTVAELTGGAHG